MTATTNPPTSPELERIRESNRRYGLRSAMVIAVIAVVLILAGTVSRSYGTGAIEGVDLGGRDPSLDVVRLSPTRGAYELFGRQAKVIDLDEINPERRLPIDVSDRPLVFVTWDPDNDAPTHLVDQSGSWLRYEGEDVVAWSWGDGVAVFAGPEGEKLLPVSGRALRQAKAVKLL